MSPAAKAIQTTAKMPKRTAFSASQATLFPRPVASVSITWSIGLFFLTGAKRVALPVTHFVLYHFHRALQRHGFPHLETAPRSSPPPPSIGPDRECHPACAYAERAMPPARLIGPSASYAPSRRRDNVTGRLDHSCCRGGHRHRRHPHLQRARTAPPAYR